MRGWVSAGRTPKTTDPPADRLGLSRRQERKPAEKIDDQTLIPADIAHKAVNQVRESAIGLLAGKGRMDVDAAESLARTLSEGHWTHAFPINAEMAGELGLPVSSDLPDEVREIIRLYPSHAVAVPRWSTFPFL